MAKKHSKGSRSRPRTGKANPAAKTAAKAGAVTAERAARLCRLLHLLGKGPQTRDILTHKLGLDVRGFYRDLEVLRTVGILVELEEHRYVLKGAASKAVALLPFPDPRLTLGEAQQLAKGRSVAHRKLREQVKQITD
jgi:predicted DNA-binding transcriptional regulator YafY